MMNNTVWFSKTMSVHQELDGKTVDAVGLKVSPSECGKVLELQAVDKNGSALPGKINVPLECDFIRDCCEALLSHIVDARNEIQPAKDTGCLASTRLTKGRA